jgi:hypothetical protein
MTPRICPRESDVLGLVSINQWPRQADVDLVMHVAGCAACAETVTVAAALRQMEDDEVSPPLPDARAVWQRAQWQARQDAMSRAAGPVVAMQGIAGVGTLTLLVVTAVWLGTRAPVGERLTAYWNGLKAASASIGSAAVSGAGVFTFDVPAGTVWLLGGALALGLTAVAVAVGLSTLADLQSEPRRR